MGDALPVGTAKLRQSGSTAGKGFQSGSPFCMPVFMLRRDGFCAGRLPFSCKPAPSRVRAVQPCRSARLLCGPFPLYGDLHLGLVSLVVEDSRVGAGHGKGINNFPFRYRFGESGSVAGSERQRQWNVIESAVIYKGCPMKAFDRLVVEINQFRASTPTKKLPVKPGLCELG